MAQVKERGRGWGRKRRKRLDKSRDCWKPPTWPVMPEFAHWHLMLSSVVKIDQQNVWPSVERKWTLEDACVKPKSFIFSILERVDVVNGEISMNPNDQCGLCTFVYLIRLKGRTRGEVLKFSSKPPYGFEVVKCDKHSSQVFSIRDAYLYKVKAQLDRTSYRSRHGTEN